MGDIQVSLHLDIALRLIGNGGRPYSPNPSSHSLCVTIFSGTPKVVILSGVASERSEHATKS
ncbi:MAG: hypothetical protein JW849_09680, partial [Phycisphaerae bacterium]|nr:hypothetical protein [Phycisphaerae bacterium]